jgi:hypothetical protein
MLSTQKGKPLKFYKITNENEKHRDMQYKTGLNTDVMPYLPEGNCQEGGIYFSREDILAFLDYGVWIREVGIPKGDPKPYKNPGKPVKWKAHRVILGKRRRITARLIGELVDEGARTNIFNMDGLTPLMIAVINGNRPLFNVLLEKTRDLNIKTEGTGCTALHFAAEYPGYLSYVKKLVEKGAKIDIKNKSGETPLFLACKNESYEIAKFLLKAGANVHARDRWGETYLHRAVAEGDERMISLLMRHGANPNLGSGEIYSPLQMAEEDGLDDIVKLLKKKG